MENIDPTTCQPDLEVFINDEYPATAIRLEYIPNMQELNWASYSEKRMENVINGINKTHEALVEHTDIHPRNMMPVD